MPQDVIAIICDCDGTLCPDTSKHLVDKLCLDSNKFWEEANGRIKQGWDPPLSYLNKLLEETRKPETPDLTKNILREVGQSVSFYPGALNFVQCLRDKLDEELPYREANVTVEWYIVSSGIESILRATALSKSANDIFGCAFDYDDCGKATVVKRAVTFTEKTKFIYAINKGIFGSELRRDPLQVNSSVNETDRRIPFRNMLYVGDGPSDIPCFSMIRHFGGEAIGVIPPDDQEYRNPYQLTQGRRITAGPYTANYGTDTDLFKIIYRIVSGMAESIVEDRKHRIRSAPTH
jgi:phosphoglycolate phosphatase-like HAD superfamily hydrolase